ncbi:uncharacterized protein A4U43_C09F3300 [Asparagus officinalis]|uniref:Uncharacterized protein n=1 Tax=Asparagus officinalis TaxID=4686 RepID=A0A5P1E504_ASPOF|nr:uncharacterized protein A4U43_C09F3300 [Asparagus officinalis]
MATPLGKSFSDEEEVVAQSDVHLIGTTVETLVVEFDQAKFEEALSSGSLSPKAMRKIHKVSKETKAPTAPIAAEPPKEDCSDNPSSNGVGSASAEPAPRRRVSDLDYLSAPREVEGAVGRREAAPSYWVVNAVIEKEEDGPRSRCEHKLTTVAAVGEEGTVAYVGPQLILFGGETALEGNNAEPPSSARSAGIRLAGATTDVHCYDVLTNKWSRLTPLGEPPSLRAAHVIIAEGTMVVIQDYREKPGLVACTVADSPSIMLIDLKMVQSSTPGVARRRWLWRVDESMVSALSLATEVASCHSSFSISQINGIHVKPPKPPTNLGVLAQPITHPKL